MKPHAMCYVPALKLKIGEKDALSMLRPDIKEKFTPILQIVENPADKPLQKHVETAFKKIEPAVAGLPRFFIDPVELVVAGKAAAELTFKKCIGLGVPFTPVVGPSRAKELTVAALEACGRTGLAVRVTRLEFESRWLVENFGNYLATNSIVANETDLIVDLGPVGDMIAEGIIALADAFLKSTPFLKDWSSITLLASAFPQSMRHVDRDSHDFVDRAEWIAWRDGLRKVSNSNPRPPVFGDWAIQHPAGVENFNPRTMQASASIRYAVDAKWLLIKGRSTKKVKPSLQMPGLAAQLTRGSLKNSFFGAEHCAGCAAIVAAAGGAPKLGSSTKWRQIGTAHHITTTVEALQKLPSL